MFLTWIVYPNFLEHMLKYQDWRRMFKTRASEGRRKFSKLLWGLGFNLEIYNYGLKWSSDQYSSKWGVWCSWSLVDYQMMLLLLSPKVKVKVISKRKLGLTKEDREEDILSGLLWKLNQGISGDIRFWQNKFLEVSDFFAKLVRNGTSCT